MRVIHPHHEPNQVCVIDTLNAGALSSLENIINDHILDPLDWTNYINTLGLSTWRGISLDSIELPSPLENLYPYNRMGDLWGPLSYPPDCIEYVGKPGDVLCRMGSGEDGETTWRLICSAAKHYEVTSYPAEPPLIKGVLSKHIQETLWDSGDNRYTRYGPSTIRSHMSDHADIA